MRLEEMFGEEYAVMLEIMADAREKAMDSITDEKKRRAFLQQLAQMNLQDVLKTESKEEVQKRVELCLNMNELEDAVVMRIQALFMKEKPSWNLVMYSILQVVDAFYTSLQIRCTAHNLRIAGFTKYKITY